MIKSADQVLKSSSVTASRAEAARDALIARAGKAMLWHGAAKVSAHFDRNPRDPFAKPVTLQSLGTLRSFAAGLLGSARHQALAEFGIETSEGQRVLAPLAEELKKAGYGFKFFVDDRTWQSEESSRTYGAKYLAVQLWPANHGAE